jgi:hypothetical protein
MASFLGTLIHAGQFRNSGEMADRDVLVVRPGNSGADLLNLSASQARCADAASSAHLLGGETVDSASGPVSPVLAGYGRRVEGLGPGLTSDSADAVRVVLLDDLSAGPQVLMAPASGAGLICPAWTRGRGSQVRRASGCVPSLNLRKGWL